MYYNSSYLYEFISKAYDRMIDRQIDGIIDSNLTFEDTVIEVDNAVRKYNSKKVELEAWKENGYNKK